MPKEACYGGRTMTGKAEGSVADKTMLPWCANCMDMRHDAVCERNNIRKRLLEQYRDTL